MQHKLSADWDMVLEQLKMQMTRSTFDRLFAGALCGGVDGDGRLIVALSGETAVDWVESRLDGTVRRTAAAVLGNGVFDSVLYVAKPGTGMLHGEERPFGEGFVGFEPYQSNFTQTPKQFFEVVVPLGPPSVVSFVAAVINNTIGDIVNFHTGERREWWEASYPAIGQESGLTSRASIAKAIKMSIERGYVIREQGNLDRRYRLRRIGEAVQEWGKPVDK